MLPNLFINMKHTCTFFKFFDQKYSTKKILWSVGKYAVCKQRLFNSKLSFTKCTVKLRYGSVVLLDHILVVVAYYYTFFSSVTTFCLHSAYSCGMATWLKQVRCGGGMSNLRSSVRRRFVNPSLVTVLTGTTSLAMQCVMAVVISRRLLLLLSYGVTLANDL